jgi:epoxyqueuosine reductase QueG
MTNNEKQHYDQLKELAFREGMVLFGVADVQEARKEFYLPPEATCNLDRAVSIGFRLSNAVLSTINDMPNQLYYFHYQRANILLDQTSLKIMSWIQDKGYNALPVPASQISDWEKQLGAVSHREIARRAGLGWYGRNNLLVNARYGSHVRYATILTDMPLPTDAPTEENCGNCTACIPLCPAQAISKENGYQLEKCHTKLKEFMKIQRIGQMICGVCVKVCRGKQGL